MDVSGDLSVTTPTAVVGIAVDVGNTAQIFATTNQIVATVGSDVGVAFDGNIGISGNLQITTNSPTVSFSATTAYVAVISIVQNKPFASLSSAIGNIVAINTMTTKPATSFDGRYEYLSILSVTKNPSVSIIATANPAPVGTFSLTANRPTVHVTSFVGNSLYIVAHPRPPIVLIRLTPTIGEIVVTTKKPLTDLMATYTWGQPTKIQMRRGLSFTLPGSPTLNPLTPSPGLDPAELGFTTDEGRLFVGIDTTQSNVTASRANYPYQNIEILTENSNETIARSYNAYFKNIRTGFLLSRFTQTVGDSWLTLTTQPSLSGSGTPLRLPCVGGVAIATLTYFLYAGSAVIRTGTLYLNCQNSLTQLVDRYTQNPANGSITLDDGVIFQPVLSGYNLEIQYQNPLVNSYMWFRLEAPSFS